MNSCSAVDNCGGTYDPNRCNLPQPSATIDVSAMKGVVGNEISSVLGANGTRHFVSPKLNAAINQPNVVLTATVFSSGGSSFDALFWWEDNGVSSGTATHSVSRAAPGWHVVQIWRKSDDILMDQMSVWIVWATPSIDNNDAPIFNRTGDDGNYSRVIGGGQTRYIGFRMSIEPKELFTANADRPDLRGSSDPAHPVPEGEHALWDRPDLNFPLDPTKTVPNPATGLPYGAKWSTGAKNKWDISRKVQDVVYNPAPNRFDNFSDLTAHARYYNLKNPFDGVIINWPVDDLAGNDDVADRDPANPSEDNDPYTISTNAFLAHGLGEVAATDSPVVKAPSSYGHPVGQVYQQLMSFREFLRLQIGGTWFRLSPDLDWGMTLSIVIGSDGKWQDSGSSSYP